MTKVLIITGNQLRHQYYATEIAKQLDVVGVIFEQKIIQENKFKDQAEAFDIASTHFRKRTESEQTYFANKVDISQLPALHLNTGASNSESTFDWVKKQAPEFLLLYGSSIIKDPLLGFFGDRVINLHLGLSPYYRGAGTNFWPLVNKEPECVGATIHLATAKVDAGAILKQVRPNIAVGDGPHDIGNKTITAATKEIPQIVKAYKAGNLLPQSQDLSIGTVYRRRDLTTAAITKLYENFAAGMVNDYLQEQTIRLAKYPIID